MRRDNQGRFQRIHNDLEDIVNVSYSLLKLIPILFISYCLWYYFDINTSFRGIVMKIMCGHNDCSCSCSNGSAGGWYGKN